MLTKSFLQEDVLALVELTEKLRKGDCFRAVSMPILHLADERVVGYEILSRGPKGAFEMPDDLFRVSVEHNLLTIVDLRCIKTCLAATVDPRLLEGVWIAEPFTGVHHDAANPVRVEGGRIRVPTGPGLGVVPDPGALGEPVASFA